MIDRPQPTAASPSFLPVLARAALLLLAILMSTPLRAELKAGDPAPLVSGVDDAGRVVALGEVYARQPYTLVYFFPKADTPGCTKEGCSLRDAFADLKARGIAVVGVSLDNVEAQKAFKDKYHFPFTLLADPTKEVVTAFGVTVKSIPVLGQFASRESFLIKGGRLVWVDTKASTSQQAADVLRVVAALEKSA